ncbi:MAG: hypothetical protein WD060_04045 [Pirellulales bacterium]
MITFATPASRTTVLPITVVGICVACLSVCTAEPDRPTVVIIAADDLDYAELACFGADGFRTPNLDGLTAADGALEGKLLPDPRHDPQTLTKHFAAGRAPRKRRGR